MLKLEWKERLETLLESDGAVRIPYTVDQEIIESTIF